MSSIFGSEFVFVDIVGEEEHIYKDEVQDGIASCAREQAEAWVAAAKEEGIESSNAAFAQEILSLANNLKERSGQASGIGCATRLQPRFQKGAGYFDAISCQQERARQEAADVARAKMKAVRSQMEADHSAGYRPYRKLDLSGENGIAEDCEVIVAEFGSDMCRLGFAGRETPRYCYPSVVGRPRHCGVMVGMGQKDSYVGDEAQCKRGILSLKYPLDHNRVTNWSDMEKLIHHGFYSELRMPPEEVAVLVAVPTNAPRHDVEQYCRVLFETFNAALLQVVPAAALTVLHSGCETALSVEIGHGSFTVVPVIHGAPLEQAAVSAPVGGSAVTDYLMKICTERGFSFTTTCERDIVRDMKERLCYVSCSFEGDMVSAARDKSIERSFELPDGQKVTIGNERFRAPEILFQPALIGSEAPGLADAVYISLMLAHESYHKELANNIVLSGGCSMFPGLADRLQKDVAAVFPAHEPRVIASPARKYASWIGGSLCGNTLPESKWYSREAYDESGVATTDALLFAPLAEAHTSAAEVPHSPSPSQPSSCDPSAEKIGQLECKGPTTKESLTSVRFGRQDDDVVKSKPPATSNVAVIPIGQLIGNAPAVHTGDMISCSVCSAVLCDRSSFIGEHSWQCKLCGELNSADGVDAAEELPKMAVPMTFLLEKSISATDEKPALCPLVIFCLDISTSMTALVPGSSLNRLECMQRAVSEQIHALVQTDPNCRVGLVAFGSDVEFYNVYSRYFSKEVVHYSKPMSSFLSEGSKCSDRLLSVAACSDNLLKVVEALKCDGCTALGPAMAFSVGIASQQPGSRVILCTDGVANRGIGALNTGVDATSFYEEVGVTAKQAGVHVSVISTEGIESGMEMLGLTADLSSGCVEIAKPALLSTTLAGLLATRAVANEVRTKVLLPAHLAITGAGECSSIEYDNGSVTDHSVISLAYEASKDFSTRVKRFYQSKSQEQPADGGLLVQVQIQFTSACGDRMLLAIPQRLAISPERSVVEASANTEAVALQAVHYSAELAQRGDYLEARINLVSTQRFLQRCMRSRANQLDYLRFIKQAEKLDQFMREAQAQASILGHSVEKGSAGEFQRDDAASKAMYQMKSLSLQTFRSEALSLQR